MDAGDIRHTLANISAIGRGRIDLSVFYRWKSKSFRGAVKENLSAAGALSQAENNLSLRIELKDARRILALVSAPRDVLTLGFLQQISAYLQDKSPESIVRIGDYPHTGKEVSVTLIASQLTKVTRLQNIYLLAEDSFEFMNYELIRPFPLLLAAGEASGSDVGIKVVDASDIIATWRDITFVGYWKIATDSLGHGCRLFRRKAVERISVTLACSTAIRNAAAKMSGDCVPGEAGYALMVLAGQRKHISMEGYSEARNWLQSYMPNAEIRGGDLPVHKARELDAVLLVGGIRAIPRLGLELKGEK